MEDVSFSSAAPGRALAPPTSPGRRTRDILVRHALSLAFICGVRDAPADRLITRQVVFFVDGGVK